MLPDQVSNPGPLTYESGALSDCATWPGSIPGCHTSFKCLVNNLSSAVYFMIIGQILME